MNAFLWGAARHAQGAALIEPVPLDLCKCDGNAWALMGAFRDAARKAGRSEDDIEVVLKVCRSGDYDNLLITLLDNTFDPNAVKHHYI